MAKGARGMGALMGINLCMCPEELTWGRDNSWVNFKGYSETFLETGCFVEVMLSPKFQKIKIPAGSFRYHADRLVIPYWINGWKGESSLG